MAGGGWRRRHELVCSLDDKLTSLELIGSLTRSFIDRTAAWETEAVVARASVTTA